jgi:hypothetical protein
MGSNRPADLGSDSDSDEPPLFMGESDSTRESTEECVNRGSVHKKKKLAGDNRNPDQEENAMCRKEEEKK